MKIRLATVVWRREFVDVFSRIALRSRLAEGNAPALARSDQVIYTIFTTAEDARAFEAALIDSFATCLEADPGQTAAGIDYAALVRRLG